MRHKVKAGALTLVLVVSLLVAAILGSLVMLLHYNRLSLTRTDIQHRLSANASSGLQYLLATPDAMNLSPAAVDLFGDGEDTVLLSRSPWGVYDVLVSQARQGSHIETRAALVGIHPQEELSLALYLCDEERPLALSGNTILKGNFRLPKAGVKAAYVDGMGFQGTKLVEGEIMESSKTLPTLDPAYLKRVSGYSRGSLPASSLSLLHSINDNELLQLPFSGDVAILKSSQALYVANVVIKGKAILASASEVIIRRTARLEDVLVTAPVIRVEEGFSGSVQLFASDSVIVENGVHLSYPSAICLYSKGEGGARIRIEKNTHITGLVFLSGDGKRLQDVVSIHKGATVTGLVYADSFVEHQGTIQGGLYCQRLLYRSANALYENHMLHATLDASQLPPSFLMAPMTEVKNTWGVVKWVK